MSSPRYAALGLLLLGCNETPRAVTAAKVDASATVAAKVPDAGPAGDAGLVAARPYPFKVPSGYDASKPTPLVIVLHGYTSDGANQEAYFQFAPLADRRTFLYAYPDGTKSSKGSRFWNASDACCNFDGSAVDDVAYLAALIDDVSAKYNVDPKRVFVVGHSNGGFMAHRLACDLAPKIAAVAALAGDVWLDASKCTPASPVAVLQVHGDADAAISYQGGRYGGLAPFPPARTSVATWAAKNGCKGALTVTGKPLDLEATVPGAETTVEEFACASGAAALWTIHGGSHVPTFQPTWAATVYDFLSSHPKP